MRSDAPAPASRYSLDLKTAEVFEDLGTVNLEKNSSDCATLERGRGRRFA